MIFRTICARQGAIWRWAEEAELSIAEVCRKHGLSTATFYKLKAKYGGLEVSDAPQDHRAICDAMKKVAGKRRRFGYRRIGIMLERRGMIMNHKKLDRLYREEGLSVRRRRGRKRAWGSRTPMPVPMVPGARWSMDLVSDTFGASRDFRVLTINEGCCRENLCHIVGDNETKLTRRAILEWAGKNGIERHDNTGRINRSHSAFRWLTTTVPTTAPTAGKAGRSSNRPAR